LIEREYMQITEEIECTESKRKIEKKKEKLRELTSRFFDKVYYKKKSG